MRTLVLDGPHGDACRIEIIDQARAVMSTITKGDRPKTGGNIMDITAPPACSSTCPVKRAEDRRAGRDAQRRTTSPKSSSCWNRADFPPAASAAGRARNSG
jgi:hypothetical protein